MEKLEVILRNYLNKGSDRIDVTMVLSLIDQCKKDDNKQLLLHNVSQQRELLIAYNLDFYKGIHDVTLEDIEHNVDKYLSNL